MNQHLDDLRDIMRRKGIDAVIIPGTDAHQSEYICDHWKTRQWITGFSGSNGTAVVTLDDAAMWTDSRYFLQAEQQLEGSGFALMRENGENPDPTREQWLAERLPDDALIAIDGSLFSVLTVSRFERFCGENGFRLATDFDPAAKIWRDRPGRPMNEAYVHNETYAGETVESKLQRLGEALEDAGADAIVVSALDEIAWLLNMRGSDVAYTPVAIAHAYVSEDVVDLFIDKKKVSAELAAHLKKYGVRTRDYDDVVHFLERRSEHDVVLIDPNRVSDTLANALPCQKVYAQSPITAMKAIKNATQIEGTRHAMERDGAALTVLFRWIEQHAPLGDIGETDIAAKASEERAKQHNSFGDSFGLIAGYKEHGAIVHYEADQESSATIHADGLLLVDSGGQYIDGTTDITRTITLGNTTDDEIRDYTTVLKGHLALQRAVFPTGTCGAHLDVLAHLPLWEQGVTYWHGTGHGVGHFLGCHEGPQSVRNDLNPTALQPGMIISDEPGLYLAGKYGIRIENLLLVAEGERSDEFGQFLRFEPLTLFPYDRRLIDINRLTDTERRQINDYHRMVLERVGPLLDDEHKAWLENATKPI